MYVYTYKHKYVWYSPPLQGTNYTLNTHRCICTCMYVDMLIYIYIYTYVRLV